MAKQSRGPGKVLDTPWIETEVPRDDGCWVLFPFRCKLFFRVRKRRVQTVIEERNEDGSWRHHSTTPWVPYNPPRGKVAYDDRITLAFHISDTIIDHLETPEMLEAAEVVEWPSEAEEPLSMTA